jgi:hypothetical protein
MLGIPMNVCVPDCWMEVGVCPVGADFRNLT